jgi:signal transduction histidine kinase
MQEECSINQFQVPEDPRWFKKPSARALFTAVLLAAILLPYWWLAVQWSRQVLSTVGEQFTFATTTYLFVLIVADSAFLIRYYQIKQKNELIKATEELRQSEDALRLTVKKLNLLSSVTRHDVLNQITALNGYMDLTRAAVADPKVNQYLDKEQESISIIHRQIEFTRDYEEMGVRSPVWQNLQKIIQKSAGTVSLGAVTLAADLGTVEVYADPLLEKVFLNLFENAVRHGQKVTRITCSHHTSGESMVIVIEDDGIGIPAEEKENIFNRRFFKNTGYGLLLAREILSITGIMITENGIPGGGARFELVIPLDMYRIF